MEKAQGGPDSTQTVGNPPSYLGTQNNQRRLDGVGTAAVGAQARLLSGAVGSRTVDPHCGFL